VLCGAWIDDRTISHGTLGGPKCDGKGAGPRRLNATVAATRQPKSDGTPRWSKNLFDRPSPAELREIRAALKL